MKSSLWFRFGVPAILIGGAFLVGNRTSPGQFQEAKPVVVWEYKTIELGNYNNEEELNKLGRLGWELVAIRAYGPGIHDPIRCFLKRLAH